MELQRFRSTWLKGALLCVMLLASACGPKHIGNTNIDDTPDNRAILSVMEHYRMAIENRDAGALLSVISPSFRDSGGTASADDDLDYAALQQRIPERLAKAQDIHVDMDVRSITVNKDSASAVFFYTTRFRIPSLTTKAQSESDLKQMSFRKENGEWRITSGV